MATMTTSRGQSCCDRPGKKEARGKRLDSTNYIERRVIKVIQILVFDCLDIRNGTGLQQNGKCSIGRGGLVETGKVSRWPSLCG